MKYFKLFMILTILLGSFLFADEGMWTFDNPPMKQLKRNMILNQVKIGWIIFVYQV